MYELIIFSVLMRHPAHGYLIAKIINDVIGPYAKVSNGRLYPLLSRLEVEGLIEADDAIVTTHKDERRVRSYKITENGRKRFHQLMLDTTSNPGDYQRVFTHKISALHFLLPAERLYVIDHYINYCEAHVLHLRAEATDFAREMPNWWEAGEIETTLQTMSHRMERWQLELDWARGLRAREVVSAQSSEFEESKPNEIETSDALRSKGADLSRTNWLQPENY